MQEASPDEIADTLSFATKGSAASGRPSALWRPLHLVAHLRGSGFVMQRLRHHEAGLALSSNATSAIVGSSGHGTLAIPVTPAPQHLPRCGVAPTFRLESGSSRPGIMQNPVQECGSRAAPVTDPHAHLYPVGIAVH
jgi:hypothetical protein